MPKTLSRMISFFIAAILTISAAATGCAAKTEKPGIALVAPIQAGSNNDLYDSAVKGLEKIKQDLGTDYRIFKPANGTDAAYEAGIAGYKLIFVIGENADSVVKVTAGSKAVAERFPDATFVLIGNDVNLNADQTAKQPNVITVRFDERETSFAAGALAALVSENAAVLFSDADYGFTPGEAGRKIGFIGGSKSASVLTHAYGFAEGLDYEAKKLKVKFTFDTDYTAGYTDPAAAASKAGIYFTQGANITVSDAGASGDGTDAKAAEVRKISVRADKYADGSRPGTILTSLLRYAEVPVIDISERYINNRIDAVKGRILSYGIASGALGLSDMTVIGASVTATGRAKWDEIKQELESVIDLIIADKIRITDISSGEKFDKTALTGVIMPND